MFLYAIEIVGAPMKPLPESTTTLRFKHATVGYSILTADKDGFSAATFQKFVQCFSGKFGDIVSAEICINFTDAFSLDPEQSTGSWRLDRLLHENRTTSQLNALLFTRVTARHALVHRTGVQTGVKDSKPYLMLRFPQMAAVWMHNVSYQKVCEEQVYTATVFSDGSYHVEDYTIIDRKPFWA